MKRYNITDYHKPEMSEDKNGEWVKYDSIDISHKHLIFCLDEASYTQDELKLMQTRKQHKSHYTCYNCISARWCRLSFDEYNTGGDCLLEK